MPAFAQSSRVQRHPARYVDRWSSATVRGLHRGCGVVDDLDVERLLRAPGNCGGRGCSHVPAADSEDLHEERRHRGLLGDLDRVAAEVAGGVSSRRIAPRVVAGRSLLAADAAGSGRQAFDHPRGLDAGKAAVEVLPVAREGHGLRRVGGAVNACVGSGRARAVGTGRRGVVGQVMGSGERRRVGRSLEVSLRQSGAPLRR